MLDELNEGEGSTGGPEIAARFARDVELTMLRSDADDARSRSLCLRTLAWLCRTARRRVRAFTITTAVASSTSCG